MLRGEVKVASGNSKGHLPSKSTILMREVSGPRNVANPLGSTAMSSSGYTSVMALIYEYNFTTTKGESISLDQFRGKALLLVNTATKCGLAGQFRELEVLHQEYKDRGLVVIGFPCDQFAGQEPETNETLAGVCLRDFGVTFTLSQKIAVNGPDTHPIFVYLKAQHKNLLGTDIKWNFTKFLVSRDGKIVRRYAPTTNPESLRSKIEAVLNDKSS